MNSYVTNNFLIPDNQYGFRTGLNTSIQLINLISDISMGLNDPQVLCIDLIFLDYSNAFDNVSHGLLLEKLYSIGIVGQCLAIIASLLYGRNFYVVFKSAISVLVAILSGVPQGGVCSALFFNLYVRDLPHIIAFAKLFQYADDCVLKKIIHTKEDQRLLQTDLDNIQDWSTHNNLKLNAQKSVHMRITLRKSIDIENYFINNESIPKKGSHKHLSIIIDENLNFNEQTERLFNSCMKKWNFLKRLSKFANSTVLLRLYKTYVLPLLEYANICWVPNSTQVDKIESVQRHITKYICFKNGKLNMSYLQRLEHLNLESLQLRREIKGLIIVFKCIHNFTDVPDLWKDNFIVKNTRNGIKLELRKTRLKFCDKNYFIYFIRIFNLLPIYIRNESKLSCFIQNVKELKKIVSN